MVFTSETLREQLLRRRAKNAIRNRIMRLLCPSCSTEYEVPDAALVGRSRKLHCTHCGTDWRSTPLSPDLTPMHETNDAQPQANQGNEHQTQGTEPDPALGLPLFLTSAGDEAGVPLNPEDSERDSSFAELVHAARNNEIEYEPEAPVRRPVALISNRPLVISLVVLLLAGLAALAYLKHVV